MTIERITTETAEKPKNNSAERKPVDNSAISVDKPKKKQGSKKSTSKPKRGKNGGARPGAGRPKGKMNATTIEKMHIKKEFENRVAMHADELFNAQVTVAKGTQYLLKRMKVKTAKGMRWSRFEIVTDPDEMVKYLDGDYEKSDSEYFMLTADKPDIHAIDSLLDRAFGRAPQNLNIKDDRPDPIAKILEKFGLLEDEGNSDNARQAESSS